MKERISRRMHQNIYSIVSVLTLVSVLLCMFAARPYSCHASERNEATTASEDDYVYERSFHEFNGRGIAWFDPAKTMSEVHQALLFQAMKDVPSPLRIYVDIGRWELSRIYYDFDNTFFTIKDINYVTNKSRLGQDYIEVEYEKKINYDVYRYFVDGRSLPDDDLKARELVYVVNYFKGIYIKEGMSEYDIELAVHDFIVELVKYGHADIYIPDEHDAYGALVNHVAVCEGYAKAYELLAMCCGIETRLVIGEGSGGSHAWNMSRINGRWYNVDVTWDDPTYEDGNDPLGCRHIYFNITDEYLTCLEHTWNRLCYAPCSSLEANYYQLTNRMLTYEGFIAYVAQYARAGNVIDVALTDYSSELYDINAILQYFGYQGSWSYCFGTNNEYGYQVLRIYFY